MTTPTGAVPADSSKTAKRSRFRSTTGMRVSGQSMECRAMVESISCRDRDTPPTRVTTKASGATGSPASTLSRSSSLASAS